jgi:hypothetical protein
VGQRLVKQFSFHDLPAHLYPVTMIAHDAGGREVWRETVTEPAAVYVPPLAQTFGEVTIRVEFGDGTVEG